MKVFENGVERDATPEEIAHFEKNKAKADDKKQKHDDQEASAARAKAKLSALGFTEDEIGTIVWVR